MRNDSHLVKPSSNDAHQDLLRELTYAIRAKLLALADRHRLELEGSSR